MPPVTGNIIGAKEVSVKRRQNKCEWYYGAASYEKVTGSFLLGLRAAGIIEELEEDLSSTAFPDDDEAGALDEVEQDLCSGGFADDEAGVLDEDEAGVLDGVGDAVDLRKGNALH